MTIHFKKLVNPQSFFCKALSSPNHVLTESKRSSNTDWTWGYGWLERWTEWAGPPEPEGVVFFQAEPGAYLPAGQRITPPALFWLPLPGSGQGLGGVSVAAGVLLRNWSLTEPDVSQPGFPIRTSRNEEGIFPF